MTRRKIFHEETTFLLGGTPLLLGGPPHRYGYNLKIVVRRNDCNDIKDQQIITEETIKEMKN